MSVFQKVIFKHIVREIIRKPYIALSRVLQLMDSERPLDALNHMRGKRVIVELKNQKQVIGSLKAFDIHINTVLNDAEEHIDGQLKRKLGNVFIRGDTIILISAA